MSVQKTNNFQFDGFVEQKKRLESLMLTNPGMKKSIDAIVRRVLMDYKDKFSARARSVMGRDPRDAASAVRMTVYKRILGGNVNILNKNKTGKRFALKASRRKRSPRTIDLESYYGADRGFILRFINSGTIERQSSNMNAHQIRRSSIDERPSYHNRRRGEGFKGQTLGFRGRLKPGRWFSTSKQVLMSRAAEMLSQRIDELIAKRFSVN